MHRSRLSVRKRLAENRAWPVKTKLPHKHVLQWLVEPVETEPSFLQKHMFGCQGVYLFGRLVFVLAARAEPWSGLLVCTSHEFHASLIDEYPCLRPHPVLGKWLYLPQTDDAFEENAPKLVLQALEKDPRIGVEPDESRRNELKAM
jgi:hypothetical protein